MIWKSFNVGIDGKLGLEMVAIGSTETFVEIKIHIISTLIIGHGE